MKTGWIALALGLSLVVIPLSWGQKGVGEPVGLARQGATPEIVTLRGQLERVETGPCRQTRGQAYIGTHLFLRTDNGDEINLHIGSAEAVADFVAQLEEGQTLSVEAFRTDLHPAGHYVAKIIRTDSEEWVIRDEDLSPFWASQRRGQDRSRESRRENREHRRGERDGARQGHRRMQFD